MKNITVYKWEKEFKNGPNFTWPILEYFLSNINEFSMYVKDDKLLTSITSNKQTGIISFQDEP